MHICFDFKSYTFLSLRRLSSQQSCSNNHVTWSLLWAPAVIFDPPFPLIKTSEPQLEQSCQALLAGNSGQNKRIILWCGVILSSCDYAHSLSVVPVKNNKHCRLQLFLLTVMSYGACRLDPDLCSSTMPAASHCRHTVYTYFLTFLVTYTVHICKHIQPSQHSTPWALSISLQRLLQ